MENSEQVDAATELIVQRARDRFERHMVRTRAGVDVLLRRLLVGEWLFCIVLAVWVSPWAWQGKQKTVNPHVWGAVVLGFVLVSLPVALSLIARGKAITRHAIAVAQILLGALLIHLTGGRIETHFHLFGSLALLAFYLDWKVLLTAALTAVLDHFVRGLLWPESIYGITNPEWWRFLEHGAWVAFCIVFLVGSCRRQIRDWLGFAEEGGLIEAMAESEWRQRSVLERNAASKEP